MENEGQIAEGHSLLLRKIQMEDLSRLAQFPYTVRIDEAHDKLERLEELYKETQFWQDLAGAVIIEERESGRILGTCQFYRSGPCIHGIEIGYIIHNKADRGKGIATEALRIFSDFLFSHLSNIHRQQLMIEVRNTPSWKVAERCSFLREGTLRNCGFGSDVPGDSYVYSKTRRDYEKEG